MKNVLITTAHKGVWFAKVEEDADLSSKTLMNLKQCKMAIKFGTTSGLHELANTGPTTKSKISAVADIEILHDVTAVFSVTDQAAKEWEKA